MDHVPEVILFEAGCLLVVLAGLIPLNVVKYAELHVCAARCVRVDRRFHLHCVRSLLIVPLNFVIVNLHILEKGSHFVDFFLLHGVVYVKISTLS